MSRDYPIIKCPKCGSQNFERITIQLKPSIIHGIKCYHCGYRGGKL